MPDGYPYVERVMVPHPTLAEYPQSYDGARRWCGGTTLRSQARQNPTSCLAYKTDTHWNSSIGALDGLDLRGARLADAGQPGCLPRRGVDLHLTGDMANAAALRQFALPRKLTLCWGYASLSREDWLHGVWVTGISLS